MNCPFPRYYVCHAIIALAIMLALWPFAGVLIGALAGIGFYAVREFLQWRGGKPFDWPGVISPTAACVVVLIGAIIAGA